MATRGKRGEASPLLRLFVQRVNEELAGRPRSVIYSVEGGPKQKTLNDILQRNSDPSVTTVSQIAHALGIPAWELFLSKAEISRLRSGGLNTVLRIEPYPKILSSEISGKARDRKKNTR